ncbi:MAG: SRPBCC family protein [Gemmatimonadaceae bacterium]|nr:SRPBCC family protein [Gemmatimonadaceae bacterium]
MKEYALRTHIHVPARIDHAFAFFADAANLARITPRELGFAIATPLPIAMAAGTLIDYTIRLWGIPMRWRTRIAVWEPGVHFVDEQLSGPYAKWVHTHRFTSVNGGTDIDDEVVYALPFGALGRLAAPLIRLQLARIFRYRETEVLRLLNEPSGAV